MADTFYYDTLKKRAKRYAAEGKALPVVSENWIGERTVLSEGIEGGVHCFQIKTVQHNGWTIYTTYYQDGRIREYGEKEAATCTGT